VSASDASPGARVGVDVLFTAILNALGNEAVMPVLEGAGIPEAVHLVKATSMNDGIDGSTLPALVPDDHLASLLRGELKSFREGEMSAMDALSILLAPGGLTMEARTSLGLTSGKVIKIGDRELIDTRSFARRLAFFYQSRYVLGAKYQRAGKGEIHPDFVTGEQDDALSEAYRQLVLQERRSRGEHFGSAAYDCSPLGGIRNEFGEIEAHVLGAVLLAEMGYVSGGTLSVRELGYIIDPKHYYRLLGKVRRSVKVLKINGLVELMPELDGEVQLGCQVIPSEDVLDAWLAFLDSRSVINSDEVEDMMQAVL